MTTDAQPGRRDSAQPRAVPQPRNPVADDIDLTGCIEGMLALMTDDANCYQ